jgi:hypothetical protein
MNFHPKRKKKVFYQLNNINLPKFVSDPYKNTENDKIIVTKKQKLHKKIIYIYLL